MTPRAASKLIWLYRAVELGHPWPSQLCQARSMFLGKGTVPSVSALEYRILTICSHIYRKFASYRLSQAQPWVERWLDDSMFGGFKGRSATTASCELALRVEAASLKGTGAAALSIDIMKCFDQCSRELIAILPLAMGSPRGLIVAWFNSMANLTCRHVMSDSVGAPTTGK